MDEPKGRKRELTSAQLKKELEAGKKPAQIAKEYGISRQAVYKKMKDDDAAIISEAVQPQNARQLVSGTLDVVGILRQNIERNQLLMDACHEWLKSAGDPGKYDIGARSEEVTVTHTVVELNPKGDPVFKKVKNSLRELLDQLSENHVAVNKTEWRHADPRDLILKTLQEARQTAMAFTEVLEKVLLAERMARFQSVLVAEIQKESPDVAQRIAEAIRRSHVLCSTLGGDPTLPAGGGGP